MNTGQIESFVGDELTTDKCPGKNVNKLGGEQYEEFIIVIQNPDKEREHSEGGTRSRTRG